MHSAPFRSGARGDGAAADTAALDRAHAGGVSPLFVPDGIYMRDAEGWNPLT